MAAHSILKRVVTASAGAVLAAFLFNPLCYALGARDDRFPGWLVSFWNALWRTFTVQYWPVLVIVVGITVGFWLGYLIGNGGEEVLAVCIAIPAVGASVADFIWLMTAQPDHYGLSDLQTYYSALGLTPLALLFLYAGVRGLQGTLRRRQERRIRSIVTEELNRRLPAKS